MSRTDETYLAARAAALEAWDELDAELELEIGLIPPVEYETQHRSTTLLEQPAQRELEVSIKTGT